ncbi:hypothetical protein LIER_03696 [Lithospermum erythrorhizon]|uniref:Uncharacterized protein n=1 Tax=Lithospermum erythrorhizon TaxID=34254 RepID=A0AAV3NWT8_LITER
MEEARRLPSYPPLILERLAKDFDDAHDPMEVQASIARYLIKALNASHSLSRRADTLDNERAEAREGERACWLQMQGIFKRKKF